MPAIADWKVLKNAESAFFQIFISNFLFNYISNVVKPIHIRKALFEGFLFLQTKFENMQISGNDVISKNSWFQQNMQKYPKWLVQFRQSIPLFSYSYPALSIGRNGLAKWLYLKIRFVRVPPLKCWKIMTWWWWRHFRKSRRL